MLGNIRSGVVVATMIKSMACGYVVNCPESAETVTIDLKEIGPTYYFAPPRIFEGLLTNNSFPSSVESARRVPSDA